MQNLTQSPLAPDFVQNPYPFYDSARATGPLFFWDEYAMPCAAGYATVDAILRDRRFGREAPANVRKPIPEHLQPFYEIEAHSMLELEPPTHTRLRGQVMREFTARKVGALEPGIKQLANDLIDRFPEGELDLLTAFAEMLPVTVIGRMMGVPDEMARQLLDWSHAMVAMYQARRDRSVEDKAVAASIAFSDYIRSVIDQKRHNPQDDLISGLVSAGDADKLTEPEIITTCILLLNAGHEATVHTIGNSVAAILQSGQDPVELFATDETTVCATTEILRYDPPLHMFTRYAMQDVEVAGHSFKTGDEVGLLLAAANRDPAQFERAATFDPTRPPATNTSFGAGIHFCVGAPLARLELNAALPVLFDRCPNLSLSGRPEFADRYHFHGFETLMITT